MATAIFIGLGSIAEALRPKHDYGKMPLVGMVFCVLFDVVAMTLILKAAWS
jgi:hypothetical protein